MLRSFTPLLLLVAAACAPQNAQLTEGQYTAFMPLRSSRTLFEGRIKPENADESWAVDCRNDPPIPGALDICDSRQTWPPVHEQWLVRDAYQVISEPLDPWRGEAIITSEGDMQVTFHQRLPGGPDFFFAFVVNPDFYPTRCTQDADGELVRVPIDGEDWLEKWSEDVDSGTLYYLNSGAYQFDPTATDRVWALPQEWRAGFSSARFGAEDLSIRRIRYGLPSAYTSFESEETELDAAALFYTDMDVGTDPTTYGPFQEQIARVEGVAEAVTEELTNVNLTHFAPRVHTNEWRAPDGLPSGIDSWVELHYAWVHFDDGADLAVGGSASGSFALVYDAQTSQTRVFVTGSFEIPRIKRDRWVTDDVRAAKFEESGTTLCGLTPDQL